MSFEDASALGVGITTVGQGLYQNLGLALPTTPLKEPSPILIYGGSTATGPLGIQFAKLSGYTVITTCSKHNFDSVKAAGADSVFDYQDPDCGQHIRQYTGNTLTMAWDTISLPASAKICAEALSEGPNTKYATLLPISSPREDVHTSSTLGYTALGEAFKFGDIDVPAKPGDMEFARTFWALARDLIVAGRVHIHRPRIQKGLEGILDGLEALENNMVSGEKLVYAI